MSQATAFCFVALKECGCITEVCTPARLGDSMRRKWFRDLMAAGGVKSVPTRAEFVAMPWSCDVCEPKSRAVASVSGVGP